MSTSSSSTPTVTKLIDDVIKAEGGYVNHPHDRGGPTKYGITEGVARRFGYLGDMRNLPLNFARSVYQTIYWQRPGLIYLSPIAPKTAAELFDTGVNMGPAVAITFLQQALNSLNWNGKGPIFQELVEDGRYGPRTQEAVTAFKRQRPRDADEVLMRAVDSLQGAHYLKLARQREKNRSFIAGWLLNRVRNLF